MQSQFPRALTLLLAVVLSILVSCAHHREDSTAGLSHPLIIRLEALRNIPDADERARAALALVEDVRRSGEVLKEDSLAVIIFHGKADRVGVPSDLNGWDPFAQTMERVDGTDLFVHRITIDARARFEYKLVVDSIWMLDPLNPRRIVGGYGENSEFCMPLYAPPEEARRVAGTPSGRIDTIFAGIKTLGRQHPVYLYTPADPGPKIQLREYPLLFVLDGGEYLTLAHMHVVLDNLIASRRVEPLIVVFLEPRTNPADSRTSRRMTDYGGDSTFVSFLVDEVRPFVLAKLPATRNPHRTGIMGASLGAVGAAHACLARPDIFGVCAAQSPAFWWKEGMIIDLYREAPRQPIEFHISSGAIRDAKEHAIEMTTVLRSKGYAVKYEEYPESHNWQNWSARLDDILVHFWGIR